MTNYVVLAADSHPDYDFLIPLTSILWKERTMYKPLWIRHKGAGFAPSTFGDVRDHFGDFENDRLSVKLRRWHSWKFVNRDDTLLLQDVDIWPISSDFWNRPIEKSVTCFYGDAFQGKRHCTSGFRASAVALAQIASGTAKERMEELRRLPEDHEYRHSDDAAQSPLVLKWMESHPGDYELINRGPSPPRDRIDRSAWPETFDLTGKVDAHLPRDASDKRVWNQILPLFDLLAPGWSGWVRAFRAAWEREMQ